MSLPPSEIPLGAMRFNSDSQKLEYYDGAQWVQVHTFSPNLDGGARGLFGAGRIHPTFTLVDTIDYINIASTGDAIDFGNLTVARRRVDACASSTRGVWGGGYSPDKNEIDYVTISSTGDAIDFGNLTVARRTPGALSNSTRGIWAGGSNNTPIANNHVDIIDYITIASTGDAVDFGNLSTTRDGPGGCANSIRGLLAGGYIAPARSNVIDFVTIATLGDTIDFGDLTNARSVAMGAGNKVRALFAGGYLASGSPGAVNTIDYVNFQTLGNAIDFGDLPIIVGCFGGISNCIRGIWGGGYFSGGSTNAIHYVTILTQGNAVDFGDLTQARHAGGGCSNAHGGL